jgi:hypothetical protein
MHQNELSMNPIPMIYSSDVLCSLLKVYHQNLRWTIVTKHINKNELGSQEFFIIDIIISHEKIPPK